jgi:hypothetical protein
MDRILGGNGTFSRRSYPVLHLYPLDPRMDSRSTKTGHEIENEEFPGTPDPFQHRSENEQGVHIEEKMPESSVHEHMRYRLPPVEERRSRIEQGEFFIHEILVQISHEHHKDVDDNDILYCRGKISQQASPASVAV